ncbi:hypothetical protein J5226_12930 [Lysobacter sp. K5869]|uniref:DUF6445 family protein n=1 Tax=Lysobacter sp. K5869 TaxID=2820808 RepID=UPI001C06229B|nr:DUF6445 family protein [Lysobacter sp. K5869]QWP79229.1 hypothetical protein J5226_12930 [Lysobacter sp. K5869]
MIVVDNFLPDGEAVRALALRSPYTDVQAPDGETYRRVCITEVPGLVPALEAAVGPVEMLLTGFRLNFGGELPNAAVHSDIGFGTHALVLYLCEGDGGTAFWRHRATGAHRLDPGDVALWEQVKGDWDRPEAWRRIDLAELRMNRAVIYESALFHSRFPFAAFGAGPEDGRLIAVAFFNLRGS